MLREHLRAVRGAAGPSQGGGSWGLPSGLGQGPLACRAWFLLEPGLPRRLEGLGGGGREKRPPAAGPACSPFPRTRVVWGSCAWPRVQWPDSRFGLVETPGQPLVLTLTGCGSVAGGQSPASSSPLGL